MYRQILSGIANYLFKAQDYATARALYMALSYDAPSPSIYDLNINVCESRIHTHLASSDKNLYTSENKKTEEIIDALIFASRSLKRNCLPQEESALLKYALSFDPESTRITKALYDALLRSRQYKEAQKIIKTLEERQLTNSNNEWLAKAKSAYSQRQPDSSFASQLLSNSHKEQIQPVKTRVCYILHNSLPFSTGGYATRAHGIATGIQKNGLDVICVTRPGFPVEENADSINHVNPFDFIDGIPYVRIYKPSRKSTKGINYFEQAKQAYINLFRILMPEYVLAASNHLTSIPSQAAAQYLSIPFFYEVRGFWEITRASREKDFAKTPEYARQESLETFSAINSTHVFTLTSGMKAELTRRGVKPENISIAPNAFNPASFKPLPKDQALAEELGIKEETTVIGYVGSFVQYEGLDYLAKAAVRLAQKGYDFRLLIVGSENVSGGTKGTISELISNIAFENCISDKLIMPGRVAHELVPKYYSLIDICPFPRKSQPVTEIVSPMKPLEAFAMQKAVIVSSVSALSEMVIHEQTGLVFAKDNIDDLTDKLSILIENPNLRQKLAASGRSWALANRTWQISSKVIVDQLNRFSTTIK